MKYSQVVAQVLNAMDTSKKRNRILTGLAAAVIVVAAASATLRTRGAVGGSTFGSEGELVVHTNPGCGCCIKWIIHMRAAGFEVRRDAQVPGAVRRRHGVPAELNSCHTAVIDGYVIEGHVPAEVVARLLRERPNIAGIAVAGMPIGSPGMEHLTVREDYDVVGFAADGQTHVYEAIR